MRFRSDGLFPLCRIKRVNPRTAFGGKKSPSSVSGSVPEENVGGITKAGLARQANMHTFLQELNQIKSTVDLVRLLQLERRRITLSS